MMLMPQTGAAQDAGPPAPASAPGAKPAKATRAAKAAPAKAADTANTKVDAATAQSQVEAGVNALEAGKLDAAVASLSSALAAASLPAPQTARALYYRGVAYHKQSKPALAIADLTSALWLKNGLTDQQRADALQNRAAAYREAGLPDQAAESVRPAVPSGGATTRTSSITTASVPAAAEKSSGSSGSIGGFFGSLFGDSTPQPPKPPAAAAASPASSPVTGSWGAGTQVQAGQPAVPPSAAIESKPAAKVKAEWAAIGTKGAAAGATPAPAAATSKKAASAAAVSAPASGAYRLQVAAVRSPEEAQGVAQRLQERFGRDLGGRAPGIDQTVMGNMGTIYRVKVGPYASAAEPRALCERLKADGMDCLIVTQ